jgi:signal transduction histidine kinase
MRPSGVLSLPFPLVGSLYVCLHVLLDWASFVHPFGAFGFTPWNPSTGLIFVFVLLFGLHAIVYVVVALLSSSLFLRSAPVPVSLMEVIVVTSGYGVCLFALLHPRLNFKASLPSMRDLILLLATAAIGSAVVSITYLSFLVETGAMTRDQITTAGLRYWVGEMIGIAIAAPFGLLVMTRDRLYSRRWEVMLQFAATAGVLWIIITFAEHNQLHLLYLLFLPITWIAVREGLEGVSAALVIIQVGLFVGIQFQAQPVDITDFQLRMLVLAVTGLIAGALVTERRHAGARLRRNREALANISRLGSMGELAAAIAHEINQPLSAAGIYTGLVADSLEAGPPRDAELLALSRKAATQIDRAAEVVKRLRTLVRLGRSEKTPIAIPAIVSDTLDLIQPEIYNRDIDLHLAIGSDLPDVLADRLQIQQVLLNLIRNSLEAMDGMECAHKRITIHASMTEPGHVALGVTDSGPGFAADFDPDDLVALASTKHEGLGIGLPLCRTIAYAHDGSLSIRSGPSGATVIISLPIARVP